jgi:hypothetical protein
MYCKKKTIVGAIRRSADPVNAYVKATAHNATTQYDILVLILSIYSWTQYALGSTLIDKD